MAEDGPGGRESSLPARLFAEITDSSALVGDGVAPRERFDTDDLWLKGLVNPGKVRAAPEKNLELMAAKDVLSPGSRIGAD